MGALTPAVWLAMDTMGSVSIPSWLTDIGLVGAVMLFAALLALNKIYTAGQVNRMMEAQDKVALLWEKVAQDNKETARLLTEGLEPLVVSNQAILSALERLEDRYSRREVSTRHSLPGR